MSEGIRTIGYGMDRPLYAQVKDEILRLVDEGIYPPGSRLPAETDLTSQLGVSRVVLREALRILEEENVLIRRQGVGTFVNEPYPILLTELHKDFGVSETIKMNGYEPGTIDSSIEVIEANALIAKKLGLRPGDPVFWIERVRTANGRPIVYSIDCFSTDILDIPYADILQEESLYDLLETYGKTIKEGVARLVPVKVDFDVAKKLNINPETVMLLIEQVDYDFDRNPCLYSKEYYLQQGFEFTVRRVRKFEDTN